MELFARQLLGAVEPPEVDIQKLIEGDDDEWRKALPYLEPAAFHIALKRLEYCCPQFVDDIVQGAIVQLSLRLPLIDRPIGDIDNVKALLARITDNMAVDHYRKVCVRENPYDQGPEDPDEVAGGGHSEPLDQDVWGNIGMGIAGNDDATKEEKKKNNEIDNRLITDIAFKILTNKKERDVFKGIYGECLKHREIEEKYKVPVQQVGITNNRLLAKIRKKLDELESEM